MVPKLSPSCGMYRPGIYHPKTPTVGIRLPSGGTRAYPAKELSQAPHRVRERVEGFDIGVRFDPESKSFEVEAPPEVEVIQLYWFAWMAFHPDSTVYRDVPGRVSDAVGADAR